MALTSRVFCTHTVTCTQYDGAQQQVEISNLLEISSIMSILQSGKVGAEPGGTIVCTLKSGQVFQCNI